MANHPNSVVLFHASDMISRANNNVSYLTEPQARSRSAGYLFLVIIPSECCNELKSVLS